MRRGKALVVDSSNVVSIFEQVKRATDKAAQSYNLLLDFEILWPIHPVCEMAVTEALLLNVRPGRGKRPLSIYDGRTRGARHIARQKERLLERYSSPPVLV